MLFQIRSTTTLGAPHLAFEMWDDTFRAFLGSANEYDAEGRICAFQAPNGLGGTTKMGYLYDAEGRRVAKGAIATWSCDPAVSGFQLTESYVLGQGGEELTMLDGSNHWQRTNVYGAGKQLATYDTLGLHFQLTDPLGTRRMQTSAVGQPETDIQSMPFGDLLNSFPDQYAPATADDATPLHFTGKERDSESGNDYFGARYYASTMGRFLIPDPLPWIEWQHGNRDDQKKFAAYIANPQNFNMYAYVNNNPLNKTDPTGMNACGTNNDSSCKVTVTIQDRSKDANGHYNDQFAGEKGNGAYNATATVTVTDHGKVTATGTYLASTVPSGPGLPTIQNGTYSGTFVSNHDGQPAIALNGGGPVPVVGGTDPATGKSYASGILVHIAGLPTATSPLGGTGMTRAGQPISAGCQLICSRQYGSFAAQTGLSPSDGSQPQQHFTVTINTDENQ